MSLGLDLHREKDPAYTRVSLWLSRRGWTPVTVHRRHLWSHDTLRQDLCDITEAMVATVMREAEVAMGLTDA